MKPIKNIDDQTEAAMLYAKGEQECLFDTPKCADPQEVSLHGIETQWQEKHASYVMIAMETEPLDTSWKSKTSRKEGKQATKMVMSEEKVQLSKEEWYWDIKACSLEDDIKDEDTDVCISIKKLAYMKSLTECGFF